MENLFKKRQNRLHLFENFRHTNIEKQPTERNSGLCI